MGGEVRKRVRAQRGLARRGLIRERDSGWPGPSRAGQLSIEYVFVVAFTFAIILPGIYFFYTYSQSSAAGLAAAQYDKLGQEILATAIETVAQGKGSWITLDVLVPRTVRNLSVSEDGSELIISYDTPYGPTEAVFFSDEMNLSGLGNPGTRTIYVGNAHGGRLSLRFIAGSANTVGIQEIIGPWISPNCVSDEDCQLYSLDQLCFYNGNCDALQCSYDSQDIGLASPCDGNSHLDGAGAARQCVYVLPADNICTADGWGCPTDEKTDRCPVVGEYGDECWYKPLGVGSECNATGCQLGLDTNKMCALSLCGSTGWDNGACACTDADGDGYNATGGCGPVDCNDTNSTIHPGAPEICNGIDDDCAGGIDDGLSTIDGLVFNDTDEDGLKGPAEGVLPGVTVILNSSASVMTNSSGEYAFCIDASGVSTLNGTDPPGYRNTTPSIIVFTVTLGNNYTFDFGKYQLPGCVDADGDGYNITPGTCGTIDCDDTNASIHPGAVELCADRKDNDCDSNVDELDSACTVSLALQPNVTTKDGPVTANLTALDGLLYHDSASVLLCQSACHICVTGVQICTFQPPPSGAGFGEAAWLSCAFNAPSEGLFTYRACLGENEASTTLNVMCMPYYADYDYDDNGLLDSTDAYTLEGVVGGNACPPSKVCDVDKNSVIDIADLDRLDAIITGTYDDGEACSDGIDNNCDGLTDGEDPSCVACGGDGEACCLPGDTCNLGLACCTGTCMTKCG